MKEIICPKCNTAFQVDDSVYATILEQVRGKEFNAEMERRAEEMRQHSKLNEDKLKLELEKDFDKRLAEKDNDVSALQNEIMRLKGEISGFEAIKQSELLKLEGEKAREQAEAVAKKEREISVLNSKLAAKDADIKTKVLEERAAGQASLQQKEKELVELKGKLELQKNLAETRELQLAEQHKVLLQSKQEEIDRLKDFKLRLSTKMVGESLEQHCAMIFEQARAMGLFPEAYFGKDNTVIEGTKGDFVFRDYVDGQEYVSIMFEMKNESDATAAKHRNDDFLAKLDKDRTRKKCEYAVLVSMLEQDSELYNNGIVDKSHVFPKMMVIRPQFFMPVLRLITQASRKGFMEKMGLMQQLAQAQSYNADFSRFESNINKFREEFSKNVNAAQAKFKKAYDGIDKAIEALEKQIANLREIKSNFEASEQKLLNADHVAGDRLTVKRLTYGAPSVKKKIEDSKNTEF